MRVTSQPNFERGDRTGISSKRDSLDSTGSPQWRESPRKNKTIVPLKIGVQATTIKLTARNFDEEKKKRKEEYLIRLEQAAA